MEWGAQPPQAGLHQQARRLLLASHLKTAGHHQRYAGEVLGFVRGEKGHGAGHVFGRANATQRAFALQGRGLGRLWCRRLARRAGRGPQRCSGCAR